MRLVNCLLFIIGFAACSPNNLNKSDSDPSKAKNYMITRQFQRVVRYNCSGSVVSDKTETVSSPNIFVQIAPTDGYHLDHSSYLDITTGSSPGCIVSNTQFSIDTSSTTCNMQVVTGLNQIKYSFFYCDNYSQQPNGSQICAVPVRAGETGSLYINVQYQEQTMQGKQDVKPSTTDCPPAS